MYRITTILLTLFTVINIDYAESHQDNGRDVSGNKEFVPQIPPVDILLPRTYSERLQEASRILLAAKEKRKWTTYANKGAPNTYKQLRQIEKVFDIQSLTLGVSTLATQMVAKPEYTPMVKSEEVPSVDATLSCFEAVTSMVEAAEKFEPWAIAMVDAWGKPGSGLTESSPAFLGQFDQCLDTEVKDFDFETQFCTQYAGIQAYKGIVFPKPITFLLGTCIPSVCTAKNVSDIVNLYLYTQNITGGLAPYKCYDPHLPLSDKAKVVIGICSIFAFLMVVATMYDVLVVHGFWKKLVQSREEREVTWLREDANFSKDGGDLSSREFEPLLNNQVKQGQIEPNTLERALLAFSVYTNGKKVLSTKTGPGSIDCIHGIRFFSMSWVVLGHSFVMGMSAMTHSVGYIEEAYKRWTFQAILNALVSVDTFFTLSGLLMTYLVLKELEKKPPTAGFFFKFYFHRFWRLTPPYMLVLMVYVTLLQYVGDGPIWLQESLEPDACADNWWANLLYINNLHNFGGQQMCMGWSWYLANDMQFYIISPAIFLIMFYYGWVGMILPLLMIIGSAIASGVISAHYDMTPNMDLLRPQGEGEYFDKYYVKPWCRIGPYLVGMMTGYLLYKTECKAVLSKTTVVLGWAVASAVGLAVVYGLFENTHGHPVSNDVAALYNALNRIAWGAAVSWVIFACANGYGGFINTLLSWKALIPLSRLTYCTYLVHILVIYCFFLSQRSFYYLDNTNVSYLFVGVLALSLMTAFVASMAFEAPFMNLEKIIMQGFKSLASCFRRSDKGERDLAF